MTAVLEVTLSWLFKNAKGRDAKSFYTKPAFDECKEPVIEITSPDCGATNAQLKAEYTADGQGRIPALTWTAPESIAPRIKEWLLVVEDPDAPLPTPILHGIYAGIPASKTSLTAEDFEVELASESRLKGGFYHGQGPRTKGRVYLPPRPLMNHGPHRYFFQVIALSEPLDKAMLKKKATGDQIAEAIQAKVLGWGLWVGSAERKWS